MAISFVFVCSFLQATNSVILDILILQSTAQGLTRLYQLLFPSTPLDSYVYPLRKQPAAKVISLSMDFFNHFTGFEPIEPENPIGDLADLDDFDRLFASLPDTSSSSRTVRQAPAVSPSAASRIADSTLELSASSLRRGRPFLSSASAPAVDSSNDDACLTKILELFPDISHQYVNDLCAFYKTHALSHQQGGDSNFIEPIIEDILTKLPYPKQKDAKRKRAAEDEEDSQDWKETSEQNNDTMYFHVW